MDLNLLISTVIAATAALIAIIGGFLVSRVITLSSEQNGIRRKMREIQVELATKERLFDLASENLLIEDQEDFVLEYERKLITDEKNREVFFAECKKDDDNFQRWPKEKFRPVIDELNLIQLHLNELFKLQHIDYAEDLPEEFEEFSKFITLKGRREWYKLFYDDYREQLESRLSVSSMHNIFPSSPTFKMPKVTSSYDIQRYQQKVNDFETYEKEIQFLRLQESSQMEILKDYGQPNGMWGGLAVLIYSSMVGIVYPIFLLPYPTQTYNDESTKRLVIFLFISQLVALFIYLAFSMHRLTKGEKVKESKFSQIIENVRKLFSR